MTPKFDKCYNLQLGQEVLVKFWQASLWSWEIQHAYLVDVELDGL